MNREFAKISRLFISFGSLVFCALLSATPATRIQDPAPPAPAPDNTKVNKDQPNPTSDQQKMNPADRAITQKIRKAIHDDKDLSTYAHNIKVITQDGKVTLRGPVRSEDEKSALYAKAVSVVGQDNVTNMLDATPSK
jgi:hyperosmotically inducible periplasmic protein